MARLLEVRNLVTRFHTQDGVVHAVNDISFHLDEGETLGIVGESGSGKSVTVLSVMRLIPQPPGEIANGEVIFEGRDLLKVDGEEIRQVRGRKIAIIFQDPMTSLNPVLTISHQIMEALQLHLNMNASEARQRTVELLEMVGIPDAANRLGDYPHQFSGGMRQRVMIAMGLSCNPQLLIADEPTTALDVTIQAQIIDLVKDLRNKIGMSVLWITHDLGIIAGLVDRVIVMYGGQIMEEALVKDLYRNPSHPYTLGLLRSIPRLDQVRKEKLIPIDGLPPDMLNPPAGCPFEPRCTYRIEKCAQEKPPLEPVEREHRVACWVDVHEAQQKSE